GAHVVAHSVIKRATRRHTLMHQVVRRAKKPAAWLLPLVALQAVWHGAPDDLAAIDGMRHYGGLALIGGVTWLLVAAISGLARGVMAKHPLDTQDNLEARRIHTQTLVLARVGMFAVGIVGLSMMLMTFPGARQVGTSLLASAGIVGLVAGLAAKSVFSNIIAGLQIALAQPIRVDDVLIVQGEWGRVEEITATYVVLRIWDDRRLIIPLQWFIENPFQNWTRTSADLLGTVFFNVDFTMPLAPLRAELERIVPTFSEWDGRLILLQVTDTTEKTMQLRVLVTAQSSSLAFDLRCKVREGLIDFMQREYPQHLPQQRMAFDAQRMAPDAAQAADRVRPAPPLEG
ncbi:MAG: mechanosensitive ion channel, partial [Comamonas sp.]